MPTSDDFKQVLSRFASGVTVVTTSGDGAPYGCTVSAFCSVSADPPRILVCLGDKSDTRPQIERSGVFVVHLLGREHAGLGPRFADMLPDVVDPFEGLAHAPGITGCPVLEDCMGWLECRVEAAHPSGTHVIFVGAVEALGVRGGGDDPILYYQRGWRVLAPDPVEV